METPGQTCCKDVVLIVKVYAWQDPESFITWGMYLDLVTQCWTCGTILGYEIVLDAAQAAVFNIHFFSETFATLSHLIQTYLVTYAFFLQLRLPFHAQWHMSWDRWWQRGSGREHLLPTGQARMSTSVSCLPHTDKKKILKKVTLVKNKLFCQVSPLKSSSLHRDHIAAPNPLMKSITFYPKTSGDMVDLWVLVKPGRQLLSISQQL